MELGAAGGQPATNYAMPQQVKDFSPKSGAPPAGAARVVTTAVAWFLVSTAAFAKAALEAAATHLRLFAAVLTTGKRLGQKQPRSSTNCAKSKRNLRWRRLDKA